MQCPVNPDVECTGPLVGERLWTCPVHGARLTEHWTGLCRTREGYRQAWVEGHGPGQYESNPTRPRGRKYLGDHLADVLAVVGVTEKRISKWLGRPCGCGGRRRKLNQLHRCVERMLRRMFSKTKMH